ncbi:hypothetical protein EG328_000464 [Venturia inaequalis]|uniref:Uncharacterized protein n=1 Tax=Venturia inaequalis TaxID=5025 RepID=A0A8H3V0E3_VENIN|nr:hypothetical protein EG328_000464 [Venturia inaequalis]
MNNSALTVARISITTHAILSHTWIAEEEQSLLEEIRLLAMHAYVTTRRDADGPVNCNVVVGEGHYRTTTLKEWGAMVVVELGSGEYKIASHVDGQQANKTSTVSRGSAIRDLKSLVLYHSLQTQGTAGSNTIFRPGPLWTDEWGDDDED